MKCNIKSSKRLFNIALTLFAVSPIIEKIDMLYYACMFLSISLCIITGVFVIKTYRKDHNNILKLCLNDTYEDLYLMLICVVGITVGYLMENFSHVHIFSVFFVLNLLTMLISTKKKAEQLYKHSIARMQNTYRAVQPLGYQGSFYIFIGRKDFYFHFIKHFVLIDYFCKRISFNPIKYSYEIKCQNC